MDVPNQGESTRANCEDKIPENEGETMENFEKKLFQVCLNFDFEGNIRCA